MTKSRLSPARSTGLAALLLAGMMSAVMLNAQAGGPVLNPAQVLGPNITFTWSSVAGATQYVLRAGTVPGQYQIGVNLGNVTTYAAQAPAVGTYYVRVDAITPGGTLPSNEIPVQVTSLFVPPTAPTNFAAYANGRAAVLAWDLGTGGGTPTSLVLYAGTTPGGSEAGVFPLTPSTQLSVPSVNPGTYYLRLVAVNAGGSSPASNEVLFDMPSGGACTPPPARAFTTSAFGRYVQFRWTGVPGASGYRLDFSQAPGGPVTLSQPFGPGASGWNVTGAPLGVFYGKLVSAFSCGSQSTGPEVTITIDGAPPPGPRTPNPAPGQRLPLPDMRGVVSQLAGERPDLLNQSCREFGGNNRFMFELVRRLRGIDNRWGLNWKRGNRGDMSQDVVNYNYGSESDEDTTNVYIIDVIGGHCGPRPGPNWEDVTQRTISGGTIGRWTLIPYLDAGYPIVSDPQ
ncbi:MAG: fibronectin type III domain-containing protein [Acidobacteriota bacterium]|nr:fibronectin type III domain-containing protein [Acidobacteriota bacterium]